MLRLRSSQLLCRAAMVLALVLGGACHKDPALKPLAHLVLVQGPVNIHRNQKQEPAKVQGSLYSADVVVTGKEGTARLSFKDGREITLSENSRFRLEEKPGLLTLVLEAGRVLTNTRGPVTPGEKPLQLVLFAGTTQTQIVEGTELQFDMGEDGPQMKVLFGETVVLGPDGKPLKVVAGEMLDLHLGKVAQPETALPLQVRAERGRPLGRVPTQTTFTALSAAAAPVVGGTAFQVPVGSEASLSATSQTRISLLDGTEGELQKAVSTRQEESYALKVASGQANLYLPEGKKLVDLEAGQSQVALKSTTESSALVSVLDDGVRVNVRLGELVWLRDSGPETIRAGQQAVLKGNDFSIVPAPAPDFTLPYSRNVKVYSDGPWEVALSLPPGEGARRVEISRDPEFKQLLLAGKTDQAFVVVRVAERGSLYWRVINGEGKAEEASAVFDLDNGRSVMGRKSPRAEVAESGLKATVVFQGASPSLTFSFLPRDGAQRYKVQIFREGDLRTPVAEKWVEKPPCSFPAATIREGNYVWYAAGINAQGAELPGGKMNKLSMIYDNSRKTLAILKPTANEKVRTPTVEASGVAPLGSKLFVNGKNAPLDRKGRFSLAVPRSEAVVFRLISQGGEEAFWVRKIRSQE